MSQLIYEASVYSRKISYRNFKGEDKTLDLQFALDPIQLMRLIAGFELNTIKSGNPATNGQIAPMSNEMQLKIVHDLACRAAGYQSEDGERWIQIPDFSEQLYGKAFLTKLAASDTDRREFSEKVILDPFRAFVAFALAEEGNTEKEKKQFKEMLSQLEKSFTSPDTSDESLADRKARLAAELESLDDE